MSMIHPGRPTLIVLEGIDLSGRTTQVQLLHDWLVAQRYQVTTTAWRTSPLVSEVLARARAGPPLRPLTYSLLYAADQLDRTQRVIKPALQQGEIVLADRYIYTAFARDAARGLDSDWVHNLYRHAVPPDMVFYLHISPEEAVKRRFTLQQERLDEQHKMAARHGKAAKDERAAKKNGRQKNVSSSLPASLLLTSEALENFRIFELKMYSEYQQMQKTFGFTVIEGNQSINQVQSVLRRAIMCLLLDV